jgi:superoxide reductase
MTEQKQFYKCSICENVVEVLHSGKGELLCCNKPMLLLKENTVDASLEKHVPVIENNNGQVIVRIGSQPHPMEEKHFIEWVELISDGKVYRQFLKPGNKTEVEFAIRSQSVTARAYCNIHGLWSSSA